MSAQRVTNAYAAASSDAGLGPNPWCGFERRLPRLRGDVIVLMRNTIATRSQIMDRIIAGLNTLYLNGFELACVRRIGDRDLVAWPLALVVLRGAAEPLVMAEVEAEAFHRKVQRAAQRAARK